MLNKTIETGCMKWVQCLLDMDAFYAKKTSP